MRCTVRVPLGKLPPCTALWSNDEVVRFGEMIVEEAVARVCERWQGEIERWMLDGSCPDGVDGLFGGDDEKR